MKPKWVCVQCGMWSSRYWNVKRHIERFHVSGRIATFIEYIAGVRSGTYKRPTSDYRKVNAARKTKEPSSMFDSTSILDEVLKENKRRMVQYLADKLDPVKRAQSAAQIANTLFQEEQFTPKVALVGYKALVCENCLKGCIQARWSCVSPATGFSLIYWPEHTCLEKDVEDAKHVNKTRTMQIVWKNLEENLINIVNEWGKSKIVALNAPWNSKEEKCIDLGVVEEGHWAQRSAGGFTVLTEPELQDFLRRTHATEGIFKITFRGKNKLLRIPLLPKLEEPDSKESFSQRKRVVGYKGHICEQCLTAEALEVYFDGKESSERKHQCDPTRIWRADLFNADGTFRHPRDELPRVLLEAVKAWAKGRTYLQAAKVERDENHIELGDVNKNHWAERAINGITRLDDMELVDFLTKAKATFGIFKIKKGKVEDFYYMMLISIV